MPKTPTHIKEYPILGSLPTFVKDNRMEWLDGLRKEHGDFFSFNLINKTYIFVNQPDAIKDVFTKKQNNYTKDSISFKTLSVIMGESTFTATGKTWRRKRRLTQPAFHRQKLQSLSVIMTECISEMLDEWEELYQQNQTVEIAEAMMGITLKVVVKALFGSDLPKEDIKTVSRVFRPLLTDTAHRIRVPFKILHKLPTKRNKAYDENIKALDDIIYRIIAERRQANEPGSDLLQMLMDSVDEETGEQLSDKELRDEIMTIFVAGHETTANAMNWLWVTLTEREDIRNKIIQEVDEVLEGRIPTAQDFPQLKYTLQTFYETMRLFPPVPVIVRNVAENDVLLDHNIKKGSEIFMCAHLLHRHPDFWEDPLEFKPERFTPEKMKKQHNFAYIPFGGGSRICIGNNFALMEAVFLISMVSQRFKINLVPGTNTQAIISITTRPKYKLPFEITKR